MNDVLEKEVHVGITVRSVWSILVGAVFLLTTVIGGAVTVDRQVLVRLDDLTHNQERIEKKIDDNHDQGVKHRDQLDSEIRELSADVYAYIYAHGGLPNNRRLPHRQTTFPLQDNAQ